MTKLKHKNKQRRYERYNQLREVGFTSKEANRYKDFKDSKIDSLIKEKILSNQKLKDIVGE